MTNNNIQLKLRSRDWCFTWNNYPVNYEEILDAIDCRYIIAGKEVGDSGTPHLQGYICFDFQKVGAAAQKKLPRGVHFEKRMATNVDEAIDYCKKEDPSPYVRGDKPCNQEEKGIRGKAAASWAIKEARTVGTEAIEQEQPKLFLQYKNTLEALFEAPKIMLNGELQHEWWVGATGTGKSTLLHELYPNHYHKEINKWWPNYKRQDVVAIEEWSPDDKQTTQRLKKWADRFPFPGEFKGGHLDNLRPLKLIVLSNYTIEECFDRQGDLLPLLRRFTVIKFPEDIERAKYRSYVDLKQFIKAKPQPAIEEPIAMPDDLPELEIPEEEGIDLPTWDWSGLFDTQLSPLL